MDELMQVADIQSKIFSIRGKQVMLDRDLAELYGVETKHINQAVRNNQDKFQEDFFFEVTNQEFEILRSKFLTTKFAKTRINPKAFTEQGVYMLATILKSKTAAQITVFIIKTFASIRRFLYQNASLFERIDMLETKQLQHKLEADDKFNKLFQAIESKDIKPKQGVFYDGQKRLMFNYEFLIFNRKNSYNSKLRIKYSVLHKELA